MNTSSLSYRLTSGLLLCALLLSLLPGRGTALAAPARLSDAAAASPSPQQPDSLVQAFPDPLRAALEAAVGNNALLPEAQPSRVEALPGMLPQLPLVQQPSIPDPLQALPGQAVGTNLDALNAQRRDIVPPTVSDNTAAPAEAPSTQNIASPHPIQSQAPPAAQKSIAVAGPPVAADVRQQQLPPLKVESSTSNIYLPVVQIGASTSTIDQISVLPETASVLRSSDGYLELHIPAGAVTSPTTVFYRSLPPNSINGTPSASIFFELTAQNAQGQPVHHFQRALTLRVVYTAQTADQATQLHLYFADQNASSWTALPSVVDRPTQSVVASTTHFTLYGVTQVAQANTTVIVDDGDPGFAYVGRGDGHWASFSCGADCWNGSAFWTYNRSAFNSGPLTEPVDAATWTPTMPLDGYYFIDAWIPASHATTSSASYQIHHADGTDTVSVSQAAASGWWLPLGADAFRFTTGTSGYVYLNDIVPEKGIGQANVGFDAVRFVYAGTTRPTSRDITPPVIHYMDLFQDGMGGVEVRSLVTDDVAVDTVYLTFNGALYPMHDMGGGIYATAIAGGPRSGTNTYRIKAFDTSDNMAIFPRKGSISVPASQARNFGSSIFKSECPCGYTATEGDPVNAQNGNFTYEVNDITVAGLGDTDLDITRAYNSLAAFGSGGGTTRFTESNDDTLTADVIAGPPQYFGRAWTFPYAVRLLVVDNLLMQGAQVFYPDGRVVSFRRDGTGFAPITPFSFDILTKTGNGYELRNKRTLEVDVFDSDGRLIIHKDRNSNQVRLTYSGELLTRIDNDSDRWLTFAYNPDNLITTIKAPEEKELHYSYTNGDLTGYTNGRGNLTTYTYTDQHQLEGIITPKTHSALHLTYDSQNRVHEQTVGARTLHTFNYSADGKQTSITDIYNHTTTHIFDDQERVIESRDALGFSEYYGYNDQFNRSYFKDRLGREYHYTYDAHGNKLTEKGPLSWQRTWEYNNLDRVTSFTDAEGRKTTYAYDSHGNLTTISNAASASSSISYDSRGLPTEVRDFNKNLTSNTYDATTGDLTKTRNGAGDEVMSTYDGLGRLHTQTNGRNFTTTFSYDKNDNLVLLEGPIGYTLRYSYDKNNNLETATDANGGVMRYVYDGSENLIEEYNQLGFPSFYRYDDMNNLIQVKDAEGRVWNYTYDAVYNRIAAHSPEDTHTLFAYNAVRLVTDTTRCNSALIGDTCPVKQVQHLVYDDLDRVTSKVENYIAGAPASADSNVTTSYSYDKVGNLLALTDALTHITSYTYDELDRLTHAKTAAQQLTIYTYDGMGNLKTVTNPRSFTTSFRYDGANRLTTTTDVLTNRTVLSYDHNGNLETKTDPQGIMTRYNYNELDRLITLIQNERPGEPSNSEQNVTTRFAYDLHGNLRFVYDPRGGYTTEHRYDAAHRRTRTIDAEGGHTLFSYDKVNNLMAVTDANSHTSTTAYDGLNRRIRITNPEKHVVSFSYDRLGNMLTLTDARQNTSTYRYDGMNRVIGYTDTEGSLWDYVYDAMGNLLSETDANRHVDSFSYDVVYRMLTRSDGESYVTRWSYDPNNNVLTRTDGNNHVVTSTYDVLDRLETRTNPENETTRYAYNWQGQQTAMTEADGVVTASRYDPLYRLAAVTLNSRPGQPDTVDMNVTTRYGYDAASNLITIIDANSNATNFSFDGLNRLTREVDALNNTWTYAYDKVRNRIGRVDAMQHRTTYSYYDDDQLKRVDYYDGTFVASTYDENNNVLTVQNELGTTIRSYDKLNRMLTEQDIFKRNKAFSYDGVGNRLTITYPDGRTLTSAYYKNDWLKSTTDPEGRVTSYTRDKVGNLLQQDNPNSTVVTQTFDKADRILSVENRQIGGANTINSRFVYTYDDVGQKVTMEATYAWRNPTVETSTYTYDPIRRLLRDEDSQGRWTNYTFDAVGNRLTLTTNDDNLTNRPFDSKTLIYSYNAINQLLTVIGDTHPGSPNVSHMDNVAQAIHAFRHEVAAQQGKGIAQAAATDLLAHADTLLSDLYGKPTPTEQAVTDGVAALRTQVEAYQTQGTLRNQGIGTSLLAKLKLGDEANNGASGELQTVTYSYDANGNRINKEFPGPQGPRIQGTDYSYDPENRMAVAQDYQQNLQGNRVDRAVTTMDHDGDGRQLVKVYDPKDGGGAKRTEYTFDGLQPIVEYNMWNPQYENFYRGDMGRILELHHFPSGTQGQVFWYHYDGLGSVAGLTKQSGQSSHNYRYEPYGQIELPKGNFTEPHNPYTFTGQEWDANTGLYDFYARHYDPDTGTWMTQDSFRGYPTAPFSIHRYQYVRNSPVNYYDPDGHFLNLATAAIGAVTGIVTGAVIGAVSDYAGQVTSNLVEGKGWSSFTDVNTNSIVASAAGGAVQGAICGAVAGATFGVGLVACGAVGGATGAAVTQLTSNVLNRAENPWQGVGKAAVVGGITGLLTFGLSAKLGNLPKVGKYLNSAGGQIVMGGLFSGGFQIAGNLLDNNPCTEWDHDLGKAIFRGAVSSGVSIAGTKVSTKGTNFLVTSKLQSLKNQSSHKVTASDYDGPFASSIQNSDNNSRYVGSAIDYDMKAVATSDPILTNLDSAKPFEAKPDFYAQNWLGDKSWWDVTTQAQWNAHVDKYESGYGTGTGILWK